ncbi:MAG: branched-chain amino acid ABC transporter substrate-binding protein [Desulfotalea sp.]
MKLNIRGKFFAVSAGLLIALSAPALSFGADTIKIGVAGAHSGDLASYGKPTIDAAELVVAQVNAKGGIDGKMIELLIEDDECKDEKSANVATKLVSDGVVAVIGHICSGATKVAMPIYQNAGVAVISPSATSTSLTKSGDYPNFFRTIASDDAQAELDVKFALKQGYNKFAIIHDKGDYGVGFATIVQTLLGDAGKEVALFEGVNPDAVDYSAIVQKIKRAKVDAVVFGGYHPSASKLIKQLRKKRIKVAFISDDGVKDDTFIKVAGKSAEGAYASAPKDISSNPLTIQAIAELKAAGKEKGAFFENAYSATLAIVNAIDKADSTDFDKVKKALQTEKVDTPIGNIYFDAGGDAVGAGFSVYQVQDGKFVEL